MLNPAPEEHHSLSWRTMRAGGRNIGPPAVISPPSRPAPVPDGRGRSQFALLGAEVAPAGEEYVAGTINTRDAVSPSCSRFGEQAHQCRRVCRGKRAGVA